MSLTIQGEGQTLSEGPKAVFAFLNRLRLCTQLDLQIDNKGNVTEVKTAGKDPPKGASKPIVDAVREMIRLPGRLVIRVRKKPRPDDPIIDRYCQRRIILDHIDAFPEQPPKNAPSATTRCEVVAHVMAEYAAALRAGQTECEQGFDDNHQAGIKAQKAHREGINKEAPPPHQNTLVKNGKKAVVFEHCDGSTTIAEQDEKGAISVGHTPPKEKEPQKKLEKALKSLKSVEQLFSTHPFVLTGTIQEVGAPPADWTNFGTAHQAVYYSNVEWLKGEARPSSVLVHHLCFEGTLTAQKRNPGLNRKLFAPGRRLMVFAFLAPDPNCKGGVRLEANEPNAFVEAEQMQRPERLKRPRRRPKKRSS